MCIFLYVKLIQCNGITQIYGQLEEMPWYMCIVLYVKLMQCSGITQIYAQLEGIKSAKYELTSKFTLYETYLV